MNTFSRLLLAIAFVALATTLPTLAQDAAAAAPAAEAAAPASGGPGFSDIVLKGGAVNLLIWLMIFTASIATLAFIIDGIMQVKRDKLLPTHVVEGVRASLDEGDLDGAIATCEENPGPLSTILIAGFDNIAEGFEVVQESVSAATDLESEKLMQRINYLNLCGQIAPMLGLLGTVTGMVKAFAGLASATGAAKATQLANAISIALWTTVTGLLIAVPALLGFALCKNMATRILLETQATVLDLIKILRGAEVEDHDEEEYI
jgi:biopolymer transport protein ExbB